MTTSRQVRPEARFDEIACLAEAVAQERCPGDGPVDPFAIAVQLELPILPGNYKGAFDGLLEWRAGRFFIYYDSGRLGGPDRPRVRYTIGHELGHWYIDEHRQSLMAGIEPHSSWTDFISTNPIEREADFFAANLLMPARRFRERAWDLPLGLKHVLGLADAFQVSRTSVVVRYVHANYFACAVALVRLDGSISWTRTSRTLGDRVYMTMVRQVPRGASHDRFDRAVAEGGSVVKSGLVDASSWYTYASGHRDEELLEEMVSLGPHGVLVFLSTEE